MARHRGKITHAKPALGYAFIRSEAYEDAIFVHVRDVPDSHLAEGRWFEFDIVSGKEGKPQAVRLRKLTQQECEIEMAYETRSKPVRYGE